MTAITPLGIPFADVSSTTLRWRLGPPELPALAELRAPVTPEITLVMRVLGASHQVVVERPGRSDFIETVACNLEGGTELRAGDAATGTPGYDFSATIRRATTSELEREVERLESLGARDDVIVAGFPGRDLAVTAIALDRRTAAQIGWRTWHTYPQAGEVLVTASAIDIDMQETKAA